MPFSWPLFSSLLFDINGFSRLSFFCELGLTFICYLATSTPVVDMRQGTPSERCTLNPLKCSPLPNCLPYHHHPLHTNKLFALALMSRSHLTASSSNFQSIINNALKVYKKRTGKDLLAHPLASQLQACDSSTDITALLQQQVHGPDQSQSVNDRWTEWLDPTISVLYAFSAILGAHVGMVCPSKGMHLSEISPLIYSAGILTWKFDLCWDQHPPFSAYPQITWRASLNYLHFSGS